MNGQETTIDELMNFLQRNMVTKEEAKNFSTKEDLNQLKNSVDNLAQRFTKFEAELAANQLAHNNFDQRISKLEGQPV